MSTLYECKVQLCQFVYKPECLYAFFSPCLCVVSAFDTFVSELTVLELITVSGEVTDNDQLVGILNNYGK